MTEMKKMSSDEDIVEPLPSERAGPPGNPIRPTESDDSYITWAESKEDLGLSQTGTFSEFGTLSTSGKQDFSRPVSTRGNVSRTRRGSTQESRWDFAVNLFASTFSIFNIIPYNSSFTLYWDHLMGLLILYVLLSVPFEIAFEPYSESTATIISVVMTVVFALNMIIRFRTTVNTTMGVITEPKEIARRYMRKWFWLDLLATFPWDVIFRPLLGEDSGALAVLRLLRLTRTARLFASTKFSIHYSRAYVRLLTMVLYTLCLSHWLGCLWYFLSKEEGFRTEDESLDDPNGFKATLEFSEKSLGHRYLLALHWGLWSLFGLGSELRPSTTFQALLAIGVIISGVYTLAVIIGTIELVLQQTSASDIKFQEHLSALDDFCKHHQVPRRLRQLVLRYTHHVYRSERGVDTKQILSILPKETQNCIHRSLFRHVLMECTFFETCSRQFIDELCSIVHPQVILRGDVIIRQGTIGNEMFVVHKGRAEAVDLHSKKVYSVIPSGTFFGEIAFFSKTRRTVSVRALTYMEVLVIKKDEFFNLLENFPGEEAAFIKIAQQRLLSTDEAIQALYNEDGNWDKKTLRKIFEQSPDLQASVGVDTVDEVLSKFDDDDNGVLDEYEKEQLLEYLKKMSVHFQHSLQSKARRLDGTVRPETLVRMTESLQERLEAATKLLEETARRIGANPSTLERSREQGKNASRVKSRSPVSRRRGRSPPV